MKISIKYRNPKAWILIPIYLHEWFIYYRYIHFGSTSLIVRLLGLEIRFYSPGKDVTHLFKNYESKTKS